MELARNLKVESVSRLQPTPPRRVEQHRPIAEAVELMRRDRVGCLLVVDAAGALVGVITERDLLERVLAVRRPLDEPIVTVMTPDPVTVQPKDPIRTALRRMEQGRYRHLPVVDGARRPVGVLSIKRVVHYLVEHFPATVYNQPPDPSAIPRQPEGA
jgi:CBS domain-containing protein